MNNETEVQLIAGLAEQGVQITKQLLSQEIKIDRLEAQINRLTNENLMQGNLITKLMDHKDTQAKLRLAASLEININKGRIEKLEYQVSALAEILKALLISEDSKPNG